MNNTIFKEIFEKNKPVIGMLHVFRGEIDRQITQALQDLQQLQPFVDGVIVENYAFGAQDANSATEGTENILLEITQAVMKQSKIPVGINVLPNDFEKAFYIAGETGARFVQMDHVTGNFVGCKSVDPNDLLTIGRHYPNIALLGGIHPKYYELINPDTPISGSAIKAKNLCDAVVVTGEHTGGPTNINDLQIVKQAIGEHPVIIGSGLNPKNVKAQLSIADGAIVGTAFKKRGVRPNEPLNNELIRNLMHEVEEVRKM